MNKIERLIANIEQTSQLRTAEIASKSEERYFGEKRTVFNDGEAEIDRLYKHLHSDSETEYGK